MRSAKPYKRRWYSSTIRSKSSMPGEPAAGAAGRRVRAELLFALLGAAEGTIYSLVRSGAATLIQASRHHDSLKWFHSRRTRSLTSAALAGSVAERGGFERRANLPS